MNTQITSAAFAASGEDASAAEFYLADCAEAAGFAEALQAAGARFGRLDGAPGEWQPAAELPVLVLYERAEAAVCRGLAGGQSPAQALEQWQARAQELLVFCRKNRRRLALVEAGSLRREPGPVLERVFAHLGQNLPGELQLVPVEEEADPVLTVIAFQTVAQSEAAKAMNGELEARAFPAGSGAEYGLRAVDRAAEALARQAEAVRCLQAQNASLLAERGEREKLEDQLAKVQAALEAQAAAKQSQAELMQLQLRSLQEALEAERQKSARLEGTTKLLRGETIQKLRGQVAELEGQLGERDVQLQALWESSSWRITAPMRRIKLALTGRRGS